MEPSGAIESTIGPYEVYEDGWFNYKAAFESFIGVQEEAESAKLQILSAELQDIEDHLPVDPKYRNPKLGALAPIVVVNEIFCSRDADHGVQTATFDLPNDERMVRKKGTKRVMLNNVQDEARDDFMNIRLHAMSNLLKMKKVRLPALLPTLVCAWCKDTIRPGAAKVSHGICRGCAAHWFGKLRPGQRRRVRS